MVRITEDLIRKRSEHNELVISTLEEIALHQQDVEKIEHIQDWCRELKILLMQNNLVSKIENLFKLKKLEYLNLAINNIEKIENLEKLESLTKLDLTLNFIGELTSVENLRENDALRELNLTGNPCSDFVGYREYVLATLPQLTMLDGIEIKRSDQIVARRNLNENRKRIVQLETEYRINRDEQKIRIKEEQENEALENIGLDEEEINKRFWTKKSEHCPETRIEISRQHNKNKPKETPDQLRKSKRTPVLFAKNGRPYCLNQPKLTFTLEEDRDHYELNLHIYKHLDTSLIDVDVQPNYIRVTVKQKIFQLALNDEVMLSAAFSKRSTITGHLLVIMPKFIAKEGISFKMKQRDKKINDEHGPKITDKKDLNDTVDYRNICNLSPATKINSDIFVDHSDVPPLAEI